MADYSCYITISNNLNVSLIYVNKGTTYGYWEKDPPSFIEAGTTSAQFQVADDTGWDQSGGWVQFMVDFPDVSDASKPLLRVNFGVSRIDNKTEFSQSMNTASGLFGLSNTSFGDGDCPLIMNSAIIYNIIPDATCRVQKVYLISPEHKLYNSNHNLFYTSNMLIWDTNDPTTYNDDSSTPGVSGSFRPVSVGVDGGEDVALHIDINSALVGVPVNIFGQYGDHLVMSSARPFVMGVVGLHRIVVNTHSLSLNESVPWGFAGEVVWIMMVVGGIQQISCGSSRLEMYGLTPSLPSFFLDEVGVHLLRLFVLRSTVNNVSDYVSWAINACYSDFLFIYDYKVGGPTFGILQDGGIFDLKNWLEFAETNASCNCFDQAAIVQIALGLAPNGGTTWVIMEPFGYIHKTNLIGIGPCNNPFFHQSPFLLTPLCDNNDLDRTEFGRHAFVKVASKENNIADACVGPHLATEDLSTYIMSSIQQPGSGPDETILYGFNSTTPGNEADAVNASGVTGLITHFGKQSPEAIISELMCAERTDVVMARAQAGTATTSASDIINVNLSELERLLKNREGSSIIRKVQNVRMNHASFIFLVGLDGSKIWGVKAAISIYRSNEDAVNAMRQYLAACQRPPEDVLFAPPANLFYGTHCLVTASAPNHADSIMFWVEGNIFTEMRGHLPLEQFNTEFLQPIHSHYVSNISPNNYLRIPYLELIMAPEHVTKGEEFVVRATVAEAGVSEVRSADTRIIIRLGARPETQEYRFRAERVGTTKLVFKFAHSATGGVVSRMVDIEVVEDKMGQHSGLALRRAGHGRDKKAVHGPHEPL